MGADTDSHVVEALGKVIAGEPAHAYPVVIQPESDLRRLRACLASARAMADAIEAMLQQNARPEQIRAEIASLKLLLTGIGQSQTEGTPLVGIPWREKVDLRKLLDQVLRATRDELDKSNVRLICRTHVAPQVNANGPATFRLFRVLLLHAAAATHTSKGVHVVRIKLRRRTTHGAIVLFEHNGCGPSGVESLGYRTSSSEIDATLFEAQLRDLAIAAGCFFTSGERLPQNCVGLQFGS